MRAMRAGRAAAVGIHAVHHREAIADLIHGYVKNALLLFESKEGNLGRVRIYGNRADAANAGGATQAISL